MKYYCSDDMKKRIAEININASFEDKEYSVAPIISMKKMYNDYDSLCNHWNVKLKDVSRESNPLKKIIKKFINRIFKDFIENQNQFNLSVVHLMDDILKESMYYLDKIEVSNDYPFVILCRDDIIRDSNLLEVLLSYQYYRMYFNKNSYLVFITEAVEDNKYLEMLQRAIYEMDIRTVQFLITSDLRVINDYEQKARLKLSLRDKVNILETNKMMIQYSTTLKEGQSKTNILVEELNIKEIAVLMNKMEKNYGN